jgi:ATP-dependent protease ClpP protease subunit
MWRCLCPAGLEARPIDVHNRQDCTPIERVRKDTDRNYWMSASEAIDYGLAYKIVRSIEELA